MYNVVDVVDVEPLEGRGTMRVRCTVQTDSVSPPPKLDVEGYTSAYTSTTTCFLYDSSFYIIFYITCEFGPAGQGAPRGLRADTHAL
jgi:hypothetical protein